MQSLTTDEVEQVGGGLTIVHGAYGSFILLEGSGFQPSREPVIQDPA